VKKHGPAGPPKTIDEYLSRVEPEKRAALAALRATIRKAAPKAEECITYGIAAFRQDGMLVGFGATSKHCALYVMSGSTLEEFSDALAGFDTSKGTIRFQPSRPLPATVVQKIVKARVAENAELPPPPRRPRK